MFNLHWHDAFTVIDGLRLTDGCQQELLSITDKTVTTQNPSPIISSKVYRNAVLFGPIRKLASVKPDMLNVLEESREGLPKEVTSRPAGWRTGCNHLSEVLTTGLFRICRCLRLPLAPSNFPGRLLKGGPKEADQKSWHG